MPEARPFEGGCLCGAVRYRASAAPLRGCHLSLPHVPAALGRAGDVVRPFPGACVQPGCAASRGSTSPRNSPSAGFCAHCGSTLSMHEEVLADRMLIAVGSLDEPERVHIDDHVWTKDQISWFSGDDDLPRFATNSSRVPTKAGSSGSGESTAQVAESTRTTNAQPHSEASFRDASTRSECTAVSHHDSAGHLAHAQPHPALHRPPDAVESAALDHDQPVPVADGCCSVAVALARPALWGALAGRHRGGALLGVYGLGKTKFEGTPQGLFYTPNAHIGIALSLLFVGRVIYRMFVLYTADPYAQQSRPTSPYSPLTLGIFGLLAGYYVTYAIGPDALAVSVGSAETSHQRMRLTSCRRLTPLTARDAR